MTSQRVDAGDGTTLQLRLEGEAGRPVVVLSHSIGCDLGMWDAQLPALLPHFRVLRFDRRGHGASDVPAAPADIARLGRDVLALLDALGLDRVDFVGLSQGGMEGLWLAANHPARVNRLVVANSTAHLGMPERLQAAIDATRGPDPRAAMATLAANFLGHWVDEAYRARDPAGWQRLLAGFAGMAPAGFAACAAALRDVDLRGDLARIAAPTCVFVGGAEAAPLQAAARALADGIPGARLVSIPGAGHLSAVDQPEAFNRELLAFLTV